MRISCLQIFLILSGIGTTSALHSNAQELLSRKVSLHARNLEMVKVLQQIEKQAEVRFVFSSKMIASKRKISFEAGDDPLSSVLERLLTPLDISYEISGQVIILSKKETPPFRNEDQPGLNSLLVPALTVSGMVKDEKGEALPGVSILIKGTQHGTTTNTEGFFRLEVPDENAVLVFSFVGYISQEVAAAGKASLDIVLKVDEKALDEVVVIGYGTQKIADVTGSVSRISEKVIQSRPTANFQEAMQGRMSGVQVRQTGGDLSGRFSINIRGIGSVTGSNNPLVVVDGIPLFSGDFSTINPRDIISIDVLKDASATAIYGARASNGVINITTRRGQDGKTEFFFETSFGFENIAKRYEVLSTEQQRRLFVEAFKNTNQNTSVFEDLDHPAWAVDTDWQKLVTQTGLRQEYSIGVHGGTEKSRFAVSASYLKRKGIIKTSDLSSFFLRANNDIRFSPKFTIATSVSASHQETTPVDNDTFHGGAYKSSISVHSYVEPFDEMGNLKGISHTANPYFGENRNPLINLLLPTRNNARDRILGNVKADWEFLEGLTLSGNIGADLLFLNNYSFQPVYSIGIYQLDQGSTTSGAGRQINWVTDATLQYARLVGKHDFKILIGSSAQSFINRQHSVTGSGTVDNKLNQLSNQTNFVASGSDVTAGLVSSFGRINYGFDGRYLVTATVRRDGSSKFGANRRYGIFPSASVAWRISEEQFMPGRNIFSDFKLRLGYGVTGNQNISDYAFITRAGNASYVFGNSVVVGNAPQNIGNPNLQWESARQFDAGVDFSLAQNRIRVTLDYYNKQSEDLLINTPVPFTAGVPEDPTVNIGSIENKGWEFDINSRNLTGKFSWTTHLNMTLNRNRVLDIGSNSTGDPLSIPGETLALPGEPINLTRAGEPIAAYYMYRFDGIWQSEDRDLAARFGAVPGDARYFDANGNNQLDQGDRIYAGNPNPTLFGGFTNDLSYGSWSLSVFFNFSAGNKLYNSMRNLNARAVPFNQQLAEVADFWTPENPSNTIPRPSQGGNTTYLSTRASTRFLENAAFLRLKDISVSYEVPSGFVQRIKLTRMRIAVQASNLLTFTKYQGLDPEASSNAALISAGIDHTPYPLTKMYSATVQIGF
ncbi:MAG: hypothetical protein ABS46_03135 [Cytophagaceae bacterium SCN 52-12]|nr:MAG: hypothetical protein ABS46_03135 [Cytophagaceae bacterium SCN 52-12]